ncbi:disease resistance protein RPM1 [Vigna unguiculata]|uniref:Disease resistance protein RPM1 n=1 Tax=Vigna unguiculata TaxID=3917 RepID=A0A4D6M235_VIGUN|nr:disease resistance protein RPM1 [Vigna unguiculata]
MAAEVVGGALLSAFLQVAFDRLASPQFVDFFRGRKLDEKLLDNLNIMLHSINALADDAEQKQFRDPHVKAWLFAVKEAVFDAEDLLGEIDYELTRCQVEAGSEPQTFTYKVSNFVNSTFSSFNKKIESEMKEVLEKLEYLAKQKSALGLKEGIYSGNTSELPDSLGDLKHLHSLDLSYTIIQKLPDSTCLLYNLLVLKLNYCSSLTELPSNLHKLTKLRCLEFEKTKVTKMPIHFGELKNLQILNMFFIDRNSELGIKQLGGLNLHGGLSINEVQNIANPLNALEANLKTKNLVKLELKWNSNYMADDGPRKEIKVLENLQPSNQLEHLSIRSYCGTEFPSWVFDNSLSNLVFLQLEDCKCCLCLPPLGLLSSLKTLEIKGLDGIVSIGAEFCGSNSSSFTSLETLKFYNMKEWEDWECKTASFPRLQHLYVDRCPKLKGLPDQLLYLKELIIFFCDKLIIGVNSMITSSLQFLRIYSCPLVSIPVTHHDFLEKVMIEGGCDSLTNFRLDLFPKLSLLHFTRCRNLQRISEDHTHNHLKEMIIRECSQFESFPIEGLSAPHLQRIHISGVENLKSLPERMQILLPSLNKLLIIECPQVEMFPDGGLPSNVKEVSLSSLKLMTSMIETLDANTCLESLSIRNVDVECFPDEGFLPRSLTSLVIQNFPNLKRLDYKGLCHLSSLTIFDCPSLECLPEEGLPKSISSLGISGCPLLKPRCRCRCHNPEGEDWGKIAHIQYLRID